MQTLESRFSILFSGVSKVNGVNLSLPITEKGNISKTIIYFIDELLLEPEIIVEAANRVSSSVALQWESLPLLEPRMSFGLRQVGAHLFGSIWRHTKHELQNLKAMETSNFCHLPKEIGPCRSNEARFFFNSQSGKCEPFAVSNI